jgi:hypothetical protein
LCPVRNHIAHAASLGSALEKYAAIASVLAFVLVVESMAA